jgi:excisionase family DNA binding protein
MADASKEIGDEELQELFEKFNGQLVSPGGAAALLGVSRSTISTLISRKRLRAFRNKNEKRKRKLIDLDAADPKWVYIPLIDVKRYAEDVGRPFPEFAYMMRVEDTDA